MTLLSHNIPLRDRAWVRLVFGWGVVDASSCATAGVMLMIVTGRVSHLWSGHGDTRLQGQDLAQRREEEESRSPSHSRGPHVYGLRVRRWHFRP
jgi:hypothetical protein